VLLFLLSAACSIRHQRRAAYPARLDREPDCDASLTLPVADASLAAATSILVGFILVSAATCDDPDNTRGDCGPTATTVALGFVAIPIVFSYSAYSGYRESQRCASLKRAVRPLPPTAGTVGNVCVPLENGTPTCVDGSRCVEGICRPGPVGGFPCGRIPGVSRGGTCPRGLVCRGDTCLP
jgi:hypothetical protein